MRCWLDLKGNYAIQPCYLVERLHGVDDACLSGASPQGLVEELADGAVVVVV